MTSLSVPLLPQRPAEDRTARRPQPEAPRDAGSEQFNSFQFWREPVPVLDSELLGLLVGAGLRCSTSSFRIPTLPAANGLGVSRCGGSDSGSSRGSQLRERAAGRTDGRTDARRRQQQQQQRAVQQLPVLEGAASAAGHGAAGAPGGFQGQSQHLTSQL